MASRDKRPEPLDLTRQPSSTSIRSRFQERFSPTQENPPPLPSSWKSDIELQSASPTADNNPYYTSFNLPSSPQFPPSSSRPPVQRGFSTATDHTRPETPDQEVTLLLSPASPTEDSYPTAPATYTIEDHQDIGHPMFPHSSHSPRDPKHFRRSHMRNLEMASKKFLERDSYDAPDPKNFIILTICVAVCWPIGYFVPRAFLSGISLFGARAIIAITGTVINLILAFALIRIGTKIYERIIWSTVIHYEVKVGDLDTWTNGGPIGAVTLAWHRFTHPEWYGRKVRNYDRTPWAIFIFYFIGVVILAELGGFIYGRVVNLTTAPVAQSNTFHPIPIVMDLSPEDLAYQQELAGTFNGSTFPAEWTIRSVAALQIPNSVTMEFDDRNIFFTEPTFTTFSEDPDSAGYGTYNWSSNVFDQASARTLPVSLATNKGAAKDTTRETQPTLIQHPAYGSQISCMKLGDDGTSFTDQILVETGDALTSQRTFLFVPQSLLDNLYANLSIDTSSLNQVQFLPTDVSSVNSTFTLPAGANTNPPPFVVGPYFQNGVALSIVSRPLKDGSAGDGWVSVDVILIRLATGEAVTPSGEFPLTKTYPATMDGPAIDVGFDAGVCVTVVKPWLVESLNATSGVTITRVLGEGSDVNMLGAGGNRQGDLFVVPPDVQVTQSLNTYGKDVAYYNAYQSSRNQLLKDNAITGRYLSNPTVIQLATWDTSWLPPQSFMTLSSDKMQNVLGATNVRFLTPNLVGNARVQGRAYISDTIAFPDTSVIWLSAYLGLVYGVGIIGILFVPKLPLSLPSRDLAPSSWISAFQSSASDSSGSGEKSPFGIITPFPYNEGSKQRPSELRLRYTRPDNDT
ncbi:hypothetical protein BT69DRAFT_1345219 [Atractiella rhizophila]|nr:hypothetical protein BT69DRAFT_1345219 [Atractiella rhizophila]